MDPADSTPTPESIVRRFWQLMASNDFTAVATVLADDVIVDWPQSNERIRGSQNFVRVNTEYPAHGPWRFTVNRLIASGNDVVTQVSLTDGVQSAEPISFFTIRANRIANVIEYWPDEFPAADNRRHLTSRIV